MKTLEQIKEQYKFNAFNSRDLGRLIKFIPQDELIHFGIEIQEGCTHESIPFTRENVLIELKEDLEFAFEKALDRRSISAEAMYAVIKMWNWILEEGLEIFDNYSNYGLPLLKATAVKYGFDNPINNDEGNEYWYDNNYLEGD